ncbi:SRPBCC family protein [Aquihabitans sp. McL0605]|uniref:SRPBCC family protein n=1 Tax=Aquihabitans sp. McL0605 TaxID=3415671 RepID=UPI003CEDC64C
MIEFTTTMETGRTPESVFAYLADLTNFAEWDPGTKRSVQVEGDGPGFAAGYRLKVGLISMHYTITEFDAPKRVTAQGTHPLVRSTDTMLVEPIPTGTRVTYRADLRPRGPLQLLNPAFERIFKRMGDDAAQGLARALDARLSEIHL